MRYNVNSATRLDSNKRLKELMLYIADQCEVHERFDTVKLNKILFCADFVAYKNLGRPITGAEYQRLSQGPAPRGLILVKKQLLHANDAIERHKRIHTRTQKRLVPLRDADLSCFTAEEITIVDKIISELENQGTGDVSENSHPFPGWVLADDQETIPYYTALIPPEDWQPDQEILDSGAELAKSL